MANQKQIDAIETTPDSSSFDSTEMEKSTSSSGPDAKEVDGTFDYCKMSDRKYSCMDKRSDSCPFAFTYETEDVESYQTPLDTDYNEEVESYQMGWLLYNVT